MTANEITIAEKVKSINENMMAVYAAGAAFSGGRELITKVTLTEAKDQVTIVAKGDFPAGTVLELCAIRG